MKKLEVIYNSNECRSTISLLKILYKSMREKDSLDVYSNIWNQTRIDDELKKTISIAKKYVKLIDTNK